jgi:hypothetical protein
LAFSITFSTLSQHRLVKSRRVPAGIALIFHVIFIDVIFQEKLNGRNKRIF